MGQNIDGSHPAAQNEQASLLRNAGLPTAENVGEATKPRDIQGNHDNKSGGFTKWITHLWNQDPDRQLELILAGAIAFFALCQLVVTIINNVGTSNQVEKIIATAGGIRDSARQMQEAAWDFKGSAQGIDGNLGNAVGKLQDQVNQFAEVASAAKNSADTAKSTLLISEGAEIVTEPPVLDVQNANAKIPVLNVGHIPSGKIYAIYHEATINLASVSAPAMKIIPVESHWKHFDVEALAPQSGGSTYTMNIPLSGLDLSKYNSGLQQVVIVGSASYNNGFPKTPNQEWHFCYHSVFYAKENQWLPCDWSSSLSEVMSSDHYPSDEGH